MGHKATVRNKILTLLAIVTLALAAACDISPANPAPTPQTPTKVKTISVVSLGTPNIRIAPTHGKAGTVVTVVGGGFPAGAEVDIHIGPLNSGATSMVYAATEAGQHGNIQASFVMPAQWPNGEPINISQVLVIAATPDFADKATTPFAYDAFGTPGVTPTPTHTGGRGYNSPVAPNSLASARQAARSIYRAYPV